MIVSEVVVDVIEYVRVRHFRHSTRDVAARFHLLRRQIVLFYLANLRMVERTLPAPQHLGRDVYLILYLSRLLLASEPLTYSFDFFYLLHCVYKTRLFHRVVCLSLLLLTYFFL